MPNIKSAIKRVNITKKKAARNVIKKSALKTTLKKCKESIANSSSSTGAVLVDTVKALDKAAAKGLIHKNTAARKKSKLVKAYNAVSAKKN